MSLTKAWVSGGGGGAGGRPASSGEVLKTGYIKKLKTMKKKFFVLRAESGESPSCLEYYDSEKKWRSNQAPKRVITLKSCFNINRRWDLKQRFVVALYTKDDCFCLALDSEEEAHQWLSALISTQRGGDDSAEGEPPKPTFEHVWQVQVQKKGLGSSRNILGSYMLCLTSHSLTLVCNGSGTPTATSSSSQGGTTSGINDVLNDTVEFSLSTIRRCGYSDCFFYMEVGRSSVTGAGELWMQTEDTNIAQNMHGAILHAMSSSRNGATSSQKVDKDSDLGPHPRTRSSSANEASRPVSVLQRGSSVRYAPQSSNQIPHSSNAPSPGSISAPAPSVGGSWRPQALPHPHSQHTSQAQRFGGWVGGGQRVHHAPISHQQPASATSPSQRRHSVSGTTSRERCDSLPSRARTISEGPPSSSLPTGHHPSPPTACSPSSTHHHHHLVMHHIHLHHHPPLGSGAGSQYGQHGIMLRGVHLVPSGPTPAGARPHSMYSRGISYSPPIVSSPVSPASGACSTTDSAGSSLSMEEGEGWCGSNGGMGMQEVGEMGYGGSTGASHGPRYGHSLTPDEPAILEENADDEYMPWGPGTGLEMEEEELTGGDDEDEKLKNGGENVVEEGDEVDGGGQTRRRHSKKGKGKSPGDYVPMGSVRSKTFPSPNPPTSVPPPHPVAPTTVQGPPPHHHTASLSLPIQPVSLGRPSPLHKTPPSGYSRTQPGGFKSGSPSSQQDAYMEMHSPCGTSPMDSSDGYMPMSPGSGSCPPIPVDVSVSKVLQTVQQEGGYVPMTPGHPPDDGYVDMDPNQNSNKGHHEDGSMSGRGDMSPAASSCSVTSGTPSTDTRFSEYHLEKVSSYFTPSEEEEDGHGGGRGDDILPIERPVRAYSVGSRPETFRRKNWLEVSNIDSIRVRAFSVGSRQGGAGRPPGPSRSAGGASSPSHHSPHRHLPHHTHVFAPSPMAPSVRRGASSPKGAPSSSHGKKNSKSSSAPLLQALSSSWSGSSTLCSPPGSTPSPYSQASGSIRPKQGHANADNADHDLMELDFSGRGGRTETAESSGITSLPTASKKKQDEPTTKEEAPYVPMGVPPPNSNYQEMRVTEAPPSSFSPPLLLSPPSAGVGAKAPSSASSASSSVTLEEYVDMNFKKDEGSSDSGNANSGYMEMWPTRKSSMASDGTPGDYVNMEGGERSSRSKGSIPEASRPIAIRKERREDGGVVGGGGKEGGRGSSPNFSLAGLLSRKSSSGTPPKGPFSDVSSSPFSSLRRGRKKRGGEEEENEGGDEGSSHKESGDLPTPTAIFPFSLNSPGSPVRPFPGHYESASKCPVDATSGSVHISYPYVPSSPVATAGSVMPSRAKADVRRRSEYSVPGGGSGSSGSPPKRDNKRRNERPLSQSSPMTMGSLNVSASPPTAVSPPTSSHEYANYCPSPPKHGSRKSSSVGSDDYMPMAPSGRVRKESVVSGPGELMAMAHSLNNLPAVTSPSSTLFSTFSPSASFAGSARPKASSDYVCMKASPSSNPIMVSAPSSRATAPQRVKSSSADYMEIKVGLEAPHTIPKVSNNADDYVEIDLSKKPGVIVESTGPKPNGGAAVSAPKMIPSVGAYVPSHTGFGFHPQFSSSMSTSSSRLPPPPASYTWPRKGLEMRKGDASGPNASGSAVPIATSKPSNGGKTDDYVQMDLRPITSSSSCVPHRAYTGSSSITSCFPTRRLSTGVPPPSTTATITATTTTTTSVTSSSSSTSLITSVTNTPSAHTPLSSTSVTSLPPTYKPLNTLPTHDPKRLLTSVKSQSLQETTATTVPLKERTPPPAVVDISVSSPSATFVPTITPTAVVTSEPVVTTSTLSAASSVATMASSSPQLTTFTFSSVTSSTASITYSSAPIVVTAVSVPLASSFAPVMTSTFCNIAPASASCATTPSSSTLTHNNTSVNCAPVSGLTTTSAFTTADTKSTTSAQSVLSAPSVTSTSSASLILAGSFNVPTRILSKSQVTSTNNPTNFSSASSATPSSSSTVASSSSYTEVNEPLVCENSDMLQLDNQSSPQKSNGNRQKAQTNTASCPKLASEGEDKSQEDKSDCVASTSDSVKDFNVDCCQNVAKLDSSHSALNKESSEVVLPERSETPWVASCPAHRTDSKRGRGGSGNREVCRRNSGDKTEGGHLPRRGSEERALGRGRGSDGSEGRGTRTRRRSSDIAKNQDALPGCKLNRQGSGLSRTGLQDGEDDSGSYEKLMAPGGRQQRKWQHNSLGERTSGMGLAPGLGPLRRQMSSPSAVPDPDGAYEKLLPTNGTAPSRRRSGDKVANMGLLVGEAIPTQVFSASSSSASSSSSLASVASSVLLGSVVLRSASTSSPPPTALPTAPLSPGEIHYASLDLAPPANTDAEDGVRCGRRSPRVFAGRSGAESPSPTGAGASLQAEQPLNYAEIDFSKSVAPSVKNRVRH